MTKEGSQVMKAESFAEVISGSPLASAVFPSAQLRPRGNACMKCEQKIAWSLSLFAVCGAMRWARQQTDTVLQDGVISGHERVSEVASE